MFQYDLMQWLLFFYFYCFVGWCIESTFVSIRKRKFVNRGFMHGPFLPIYGSGAVMMLIVSKPFAGNLFFVFFAGLVGATVLEYVTGVVMEALFKVRYWDYSNDFLNFQGHVCLGSSVAWGFLTIVMTKVIHAPIESLLLSVPKGILQMIVIVLTVILAIDFALSVKAALNLRDILIKMEKAKEELVHLQKRLDVIIALSSEAKEEIMEGIENRYEEWKENRELRKEEKHRRLEEIYREIENRIEEWKDNVKEKTPDLFDGLVEEMSQFRKKLFTHRDRIQNNPSMKSVKFKEALEELKEMMNEGKKK